MGKQLIFKSLAFYSFVFMGIFISIYKGTYLL